MTRFNGTATVMVTPESSGVISHESYASSERFDASGVLITWLHGSVQPNSGLMMRAPSSEVERLLNDHVDRYSEVFRRLS